MHIQNTTMHKFIFLLSALTACGVSCGEIKKLDGLPGTTTEQYIDCICYAKTGSWDINLCGHRSITLAYWQTTSTEEDKNCILNTIQSYTEQYGAMDCNSNGIPTVIFDRFHSCLSHAIKNKSRGRYKRSIYQNNQNINLRVNQNANGDNNRARQNVHVHVGGG